MEFISKHTSQLGKRLYEGLSKMMHSNGTPVVRIYNDVDTTYGDPSVQGATIAFNVQRPNECLIGFEEVEEAANEKQIYVRSGSLCNPGGVATYLNWSPAEMRAAYAGGHRCANPQQIIFGKATGVVRISLGAMSVASDVKTFLNFLEEVYMDQPSLAPDALALLQQVEDQDLSKHPSSINSDGNSRAEVRLGETGEAARRNNKIVDPVKAKGAGRAAINCLWRISNRSAPK